MEMKASQMHVDGLQVLQYDRHVAHGSFFILARHDLCEVHFASHEESACSLTTVDR